MIELYQYLIFKRQLKQWSMTEMAAFLGVSVRTYQKLEHQITVRPSVVSAVLKTTGFGDWDEETLRQKELMLDRFFRKILYAEYKDAEPVAKHLNIESATYLNSPLLIKYLLYMWIYVIHTQQPIFSLEEYFAHLSHLEGLMPKPLQELFWVEKTGYYFVIGELKTSFDHFDSILAFVEDNHYKALSYFLVGASGVNEITSLDQSILYLTLAHDIFMEHGNYLRANRCNAFLQVAYIHARRYDEFFDLYNNKEMYFQDNEDIPRMKAFVEGNLARYYCITDQFEEALKILRPLDFPSNINYFLYLVAAFQTHSHDDLKRLLGDATLEDQFLNAHHRQFYQSLKTYQHEKKSHPFLAGLKKAVEASEKANDYIAYLTINQILVQTLKSEKRYKEAYQQISQKLDILRQFH
jgi:transcriptional regulator with XRE-family HTH domain